MAKSQPILLVDADPHWRTTLCRRLSKLGYHVTAASSVAEAHDLASRVHPAMILVDRGLPGDGEFGRTVLRELRGDPQISHIPVLMTNARQRAAFTFSF
jgi:CheY-like chemotaxis protein